MSVRDYLGRAFSHSLGTVDTVLYLEALDLYNETKRISYYREYIPASVDLESSAIDEEEEAELCI